MNYTFAQKAFSQWPFSIAQVVGWGPHFEDLASGLAEFAVDGTVVSVINPERPRGLPEQPLRGIQFNHIEGSATSFNSFRQADLADCDSILLGKMLTPPSCHQSHSCLWYHLPHYCLIAAHWKVVLNDATPSLLLHGSAGGNTPALCDSSCAFICLSKLFCDIYVYLYHAYTT